MTLPIENAGVYNDLRGLAALKRDAKDQDPAALRAAAKQFESLFARMMLKSMREASFGDSLMGSDQQDFYQGMFDDQLAVDMTKGKGLGLADMLVQQLTRAGLAPQQDASAPPMKPNSLLNPLAAPSSTTPEKALAMVGEIDVKAGAPLVAAAPDVARDAWPPASPEDFVKQLWPVAQQAGRELGIDPRHILAQAALETGWGRAVPSNAEGESSFNFFGIKIGSQWTGNAVAVRTLEFENGIPVPKTERFRSYDSPQDCFRDYVALLKGGSRYSEALNTGADAKAFASALQKGGYATDPAYAQKIASIAQNLSSAIAPLKSADARPINSTTEPL